MQTEPDFDLDIKEDVEEECSKYGRVKHIYVDKYVCKLVHSDMHTPSHIFLFPISFCAYLQFYLLIHFVYRNSAGFVYLMFETVEAASAAQRAMHMRWFARKMISAIYMVSIGLLSCSLCLFLQTRILMVFFCCCSNLRYMKPSLKGKCEELLPGFLWLLKTTFCLFFSY